MRVAVLGPLVVTANDSAPVIVPGADERLLLAVLAAQARRGPRGAGWSRRCGAADLGAGRRVRCRPPSAGCAPRSNRGCRSARAASTCCAAGRATPWPCRGATSTRSRFTDLARPRARAPGSADPAEAEWLLSTALALWRGEPYGEWPDAPFARAERQRLTATRDAAEADLARGPGAAPGPVVARAGPVPAPGGSARPSVARRRRPAGRRRRSRVPATSPRRLRARPAPRSPPSASRPGVPARPRGRRAADCWSSGSSCCWSRRCSWPGCRAARAAGAGRRSLVADADRLAALSRPEKQLDVSLLLAAQAYRLADTPDTRGALTAVLDGHERVERAVSFYGVPQDAVLSGRPHADLRRRGVRRGLAGRAGDGAARDPAHPRSLGRLDRRRTLAGRGRRPRRRDGPARALDPPGLDPERGVAAC